MVSDDLATFKKLIGVWNFFFEFI